MKRQPHRRPTQETTRRGGHEDGQAQDQQRHFHPKIDLEVAHHHTHAWNLFGLDALRCRLQHLVHASRILGAALVNGDPDDQLQGSHH
ncbi:MAG: hypothetical protein ACK559_03905 [bacterium]